MIVGLHIGHAVCPMCKKDWPCRKMLDFTDIPDSVETGLTAYAKQDDCFEWVQKRDIVRELRLERDRMARSERHRQQRRRMRP